MFISELASEVKGRSVTCFENIARIRRLIYPNLFFARRVVEMIVLPQSVVSLVEAMYQSAFLSLEFRLNSELVSSVARHKFKKIRQKFRFNSLSNFTTAISRGNKVFCREA